MRGQSGGKVKKISGLSENFLVVRRTYPSAFGSPGIGGPYSNAFKSVGQVYPHKGTSDPIPTLLEALE